jgi:hypothetical protein
MRKACSVGCLDGVVQPGGIVLFGEVHGTREIPGFVGDALCQAAASGEVHLALEIPRTEQPRIDAYLASPGRPADRAALLSGPFWTDEFQDGRRSAAMAELIERARGLRAAGRALHVLAFDAAPDTKGGDRDAEMAKRILDAQAASPADRFLVLAGNIHTRTARGTPWNASYEPMGLHLVAAGRDVVSLDAAFATGTAWVCFSSKAAECGAKKLRGQEGIVPRTIARLSVPSPEGFHGKYGVGPVSASPPAHPHPRPAAAAAP